MTRFRAECRIRGFPGHWEFQQRACVALHSVPFYIIDADNIYRANPNTSPTKYSQTPRWKRRTSSCIVL